MKVSIVKQGNNESIVLPNNDVTVIGRGVFGINDKRISKHHGEITVNNNKIKIKSCHKNPIYFKIGNDSKDILYQDAEISLNNNDFFSLLPDDFEFQVKIESDQVSESNDSNTLSAPFRVREITEINDNLEAGAVPVTLSQVLRDVPEDESNPQPQVSSSSTTTRKRSIEPETTSELPKKIKTEPQDEQNTASTSTVSNENPSCSSSNQSISNDVQIKPDPDSSTNQLPSTSTSANVKQEPADSSNAQPVTRPSCDHGIRCFRHNPDHRRGFAHPGDNDYRRPEFPPAVQGAPRCPYWAACYRRNPDHFRMFEHPPSSTYDPNQQPPPQPVQVQPLPLPPRRIINVNVYNVYDDENEEEEDEDMFDDFDDTDVDADYEINGETPSDEDENNLEE